MGRLSRGANAFLQRLLATPSRNAFSPSQAPIVIYEALTLGLRTGGITALVMDSAARP
jgi:hypothetical protein